MMELAVLRRHIKLGRDGTLPVDPMKPGTYLSSAPHVFITLLGEFKGELGFKYHLILNKLKDRHDIAKAVKADDAKVPVELWDKAVCRQPPTVEQLRALLILRGFMLRLYCL